MIIICKPNDLCELQIEGADALAWQLNEYVYLQVGSKLELKTGESATSSTPYWVKGTLVINRVRKKILNWWIV